MTTVDVRIERVGSGDRLFLQNGMWGPATSVLHAFGRACQDGRIPSSKWNVAEINEVTTGAVVRQALDAITDWDWQQSRDSADQDESRPSGSAARRRRVRNSRPGGLARQTRAPNHANHLPEPGPRHCITPRPNGKLSRTTEIATQGQPACDLYQPRPAIPWH